MSNTARTDEIDEVMSSVRKLVSTKEAPAIETPPAFEKLVLTPALRVDVEEESTPATDTSVPADNILVLDSGKRADRAGLEATIAELEAAVTAQPDEWEPDEGESFDTDAWAASAFEAPQGDDVPDASLADAALVDDVEPATDEPVDAPIGAPSVADDLPAGIDEDALRAMVIQIVREELNGDMGERITRNVRKMVRREINRILVSRDLS